MHVVFRADGNETIGLGHVKRCEVLARELSGRGHKVSFLSTENEFVEGYLTGGGFRVNTVKPAADRDEKFALTAAAVESIRPDAVFLDILNTEPGFIRRLHAAGARVISIDDLGQGGAEVDALVGEDVGVLDEWLPQEVKEASAGRIFGGLDYVIMSPRFLPLRGSKTSAHHQRRNIYIGFGGSDPRGTTEQVIAALLDWPAEFTANVVLGPCMASPEKIERLAAHDPRFVLHRDPPGLPQLMADASIALCNVGQSLFELTLLGTPTLLITSSELQERFAVNFERNGCSVNLGLHDNFDKPEMLRHVGGILDHAARWNAMRLAALRLIDGKGAGRIADVIERVLREKTVAD